MTEEKKQEEAKAPQAEPAAPKEAPKAETKPEQPKEAPAPAQAAPAEQPAAAPAAEKPKEAKKAAEVKIEKPANCVACNKSIKKKWYYRNGKYYCTKRCWQTATKKEEKPKEGEAATAK